MSDFTSAIDQIELVHQGKKDAQELTIEALARIDAIDRNGYQLNSILALSFDALENSEKINPALPLAGIPVVIKDNVEAIGLPASAGSLAPTSSVPPIFRSGQTFDRQSQQVVGLHLVDSPQIHGNIHTLQAGHHLGLVQPLPLGLWHLRLAVKQMVPSSAQHRSMVV